MFAVGDKIGAYTIRRRIGAGGMGEVYLAEHLHIGRKAAIKVLLPGLSSRPDVVARFFNEARATGLLRHPNIVEIFDCDVHVDGRAYMVMEYLKGETVGQCLARLGNFGRQPSVAAAIAGQIAAGLAAAHAKGIVHRDLKPDNVFLASNAGGEPPILVKILDFGIAKLIGDGTVEARKTRTGTLLGTPLYMSPEQCRGAGRIDHRTDVYSLGCIIFELLSGRPPFVREGNGELIIAHNSEPPPPLASLIPSLSPSLAALVGRMLEKDVAARPQTMTEIIQSIESLLRVPAAQFAAQIRAISGFPANGMPEEAPDQDPAMTFVPPTTEGPNSLSPAAASPVPRTEVQNGKTRAQLGSKTTLSQAASAMPAGAGSVISRLWRGTLVGFGFLTLAGVLLFAVLREPGRSPESRSTAGSVAPPAARIPNRDDPPPSPKMVTLDLEKAPQGLVAELDGRPASVPVVIPSGPGVHQLTLQAPGFTSEVLQVDGSRDRTIVLNMQPVPRAAPPPAKAPEQRPSGASGRPPRVGVTPHPPIRKRNEGFTDF